MIQRVRDGGGRRGFTGDVSGPGRPMARHRVAASIDLIHVCLFVYRMVGINIKDSVDSDTLTNTHPSDL